MIYVLNEPHFQGQKLEDKDWMILEPPKTVSCRQHEGMLQTCKDGKWSTNGGLVASAESWPHLVSLLMGQPELTLAMVQQRVFIVATPESYGSAPKPGKVMQMSGGTDGQAETA